MEEQTKEPWKLEHSGGFITIFPEDEKGRIGPVIYDKEDDGIKLADALRIVACVNACAGLKTEGLEKGGLGCLSHAIITQTVETALREAGIKK